MLDIEFHDLDAFRRLFPEVAAEWYDPEGLGGLPSSASCWPPRLAPFFALFQELLADLFAVRDKMLQAQACGRQPSPALSHQYEQDLQWISSDDERLPFSFGWICQALGLDPARLRCHYLSGKPVAFEGHRVRLSRQQQMKAAG